MAYTHPNLDNIRYLTKPYALCASTKLISEAYPASALADIGSVKQSQIFPLHVCIPVYTKRHL